MSQSDVGVYLLAAGESSRMGRSKPLLPFGAGTVLSTLVEAFRAGGCERIAVVGRAADADLQSHVTELGARFLTNEAPEKGMAHSVGLASADCSAGWLAVCPADMPKLTSDVISACLAACEHSESVVQPSCEGRARHPVFVAARLLADLSRFLSADRTLRDWLNAQARNFVEFEDCSPFADIDTPDDYDRINR